MKKLFLSILTILALSPMVLADDYLNSTEIDLDSIRYNKVNNSAEIRMKMYNSGYNPGQNDMRYALYYFKMDCSQRMFKPMLIEGYNKRDELMLVDYANRHMQPVAPGSDIEQAYNYACQIHAIPDVAGSKK